MKKLLIPLCLVAITGCSPVATEIFLPLVPEALRDCKTYYIQDVGGGVSLTVMRCPMSSTSVTYKSGKTNRNTVVIDGQQYVEEEPK